MGEEMTTNLHAIDATGNEGLLVAKAVANAGAALGMSQAEIGEVIGVSQAQVNKIAQGTALLKGKPFDLALCLVRIFRSLDTFTGGDVETNRAWMRNRNLALGGVPAELIKSAEGLVNTMAYLDAARAPI